VYTYNLKALYKLSGCPYKICEIEKFSIKLAEIKGNVNKFVSETQVEIDNKRRLKKTIVCPEPKDLPNPVE
jgi:hypothetical protein